MSEAARSRQDIDAELRVEVERAFMGGLLLDPLQHDAVEKVSIADFKGLGNLFGLRR